jgi:hypothetical protein
VKPVSNPAMNCAAGSSAILIDRKAVCISPETCPSGYGVSGNSCVVKCSAGQILLKDGSCCHPGQATSQGTCCPGNLSPQPDGFCGPARGSARSLPSTPQFNNPQQCANGLVPRDAFRDDPVCVTTIVRDQIIADNAAAPSRTKPDGSCVEDYVWREATESDHVCVPLPTRAQTWADNSRQCGDERCKPRATTTQNNSADHKTSTEITEHPKPSIFRPRSPRHSIAGRTVSRRLQPNHPWRQRPSVHHGGFGSRGGSFHGGGFPGGGFRGGGFHVGGFHGGGRR